MLYTLQSLALIALKTAKLGLLPHLMIDFKSARFPHGQPYYNLEHF